LEVPPSAIQFAIRSCSSRPSRTAFSHWRRPLGSDRYDDGIAPGATTGTSPRLRGALEHLATVGPRGS
jgi:hypothetical protein